MTVTLLLLGQAAWGTTKTVTYTMTSHEKSGMSNYEVVFTRSGDAPFDTSAPATYTCTVAESGLSTSGGAGGFSLTLADGFTFSGSWGSGSNVAFVGNNICIQASGKTFNYSLLCQDTYYYVTNVQIAGREGTWNNTNYDSVWGAILNCSSANSFSALTITYSDVPTLGIFESAGTNTYKIKDRHDLRHLANYVNNGKQTCSGLTFRQSQDITCDDTYVPIGSRPLSGQRNYFKGTYDGQGHRIDHITVNRTGGDLYADGYIGLFGLAGMGGVIKNIVLANSTFTGYKHVGGIAGQCEGTVQNCRVESTVIIKASNSAYNYGGIVGNLGGIGSMVIGCVCAATVNYNNEKRGSYFGGIVGYTYSGIVKDCLYAGTSITADNKKGAIIGYDQDGKGTFTNNYYTAIELGGVEGSDQDGARRACTVTLGDGVSIVGDVIIYDVSGLRTIGTGNYALRYGSTIYSGAGQTLTLDYTAAIPEGYALGGYSVKDASDQDVAVTNTSGTYTFVMPDKNVTVTAILERAAIGSIRYNETLGAYEVNCAQHLRDLSSYLYETIDEPSSKKHYCTDLTFKMTADIDFAPTSAWNDYDSDEHNFTAIGYQTEYSFDCYSAFKGTFDGQGHTISGIRNNNGALEQALFGYVWGGTVKNVTLANTRIRGWSNSGGIVGMNAGTVQNCHVASDVAIRVTRSGACSIGGIVGENAGTVTGCTSAAVIVKTSVTECSAFGGVVGDNGKDCTVSDCTAAGVILPGVDKSGAVVGQNFGTISGNTYHSSMVVGDAITIYAFNIGTGTGDVSGATLVTNKLFFYDNRNNSNLTTAYAKPYARNNSSTAHGVTCPNIRWVDLTLKGRTFYKDGTWNTLSLPFDVSSLSNTPLSGATIMTLDTDNSTYNSGTGALTVAFKSASSIAERTPYMVKWTSGSDITDPTFKDVNAGDLSTFTQTVTAGLVKFNSNFAPLSSTEGKLFDAHNADNRGYHSYITIAAPETPEGFSFSGWYADDAFTTPVTNTIPFGPDGTFSLYARQFGNTPTLTGHLYEGRYWATFYHRTLRFTLPSGATAYTMGADHQLYRLGTDGRTIPAGVAVVILADSESIALTLSTDNSPVTDNAPDGNILRGTDSAITVTGGKVDGKTPYVLGVTGTPAVLGFYKYTGSEIPANKAYYIQ